MNPLYTLPNGDAIDAMSVTGVRLREFQADQQPWTLSGVIIERGVGVIAIAAATNGAAAEMRDVIIADVNAARTAKPEQEFPITETLIEADRLRGLLSQAREYVAGAAGDPHEPDNSADVLLREIDAALQPVERLTMEHPQQFINLADYCDFPANNDGAVFGRLPDDCKGIERSNALEAAGYEVHVARFDDCFDEFVPELLLAAWQPAEPNGDGWTLAWKCADEDGLNAVFWRAKPVEG